MFRLPIFNVIIFNVPIFNVICLDLNLPYCCLFSIFLFVFLSFFFLFFYIIFMIPIDLFVGLLAISLPCYWFLYCLQYTDTSLTHHSLLSDCVKPFHVKCKKLFPSFALLSRFTPMCVINTMGCWYYFIFN